MPPVVFFTFKKINTEYCGFTLDKHLHLWQYVVGLASVRHKILCQFVTIT